MLPVNPPVAMAKPAVGGYALPPAYGAWQPDEAHSSDPLPTADVPLLLIGMWLTEACAASAPVQATVCVLQLTMLVLQVTPGA